MPRTVTVTFGDGSSHVYNGVPDDATPDAVVARAGKDFPSLQIKNIDGGRGAEAKAAPTMQPPTVAPYAEVDPELSMRDVGQAARGAASFVGGIPGELERLALRGTTALGLTKPDEKPVLPSQEDVSKYLGAEPTDERARGYRQLGEAGAMVGTALPAVTETAVRAAPTLARGAAAIGRGIVGAAEKTPVIGKAIGREAAQAKGGILQEGTQGVGDMIADAKKEQETKAALDAVTQSRPNATVLSVEKPAAVDTSKVSQARADSRAATQRVTEATTKLQEAQRRMSSLDKYAGQRRSEAMVRAARRDLNVAQREVNEATAARDEAVTAQREIETQHRAALQDQRTSQRKETTSARQIERAASSAKTRIANLEGLRAELNAPGATPQNIAGSARKIGKQLLASGKISEKQYQDYLGRVNKMVEHAADTKEARKRLFYLLAGGALAGAIGRESGMSYEIRRLFQP